MACCASTSRKAPTSRATPSKTWRRSLRPSMRGPARHSTGEHPPKPSPPSYTRSHKQVLQRPLEPNVDVQVHHVRKLADLHRHGRSRNTWTKIMVERRRKTLIVCAACHT